ncbi:MAG: hypothetical protein Q9M91_02535 [Candidatus Dojkabacteria bacterium]|nr:hypothetical protein [Candidatus Dojkabacteria bacterium]MDQ7020702.1 hypothetical protein [Candidatus Dojkabacteria bacterium]
MHKTEDGKVIASLTEVKNKTGDIFALVDEFGEVTLTSYNKPRYKISKIGVADMLESRDSSTTDSIKNTVKKVVPSLKKTTKKKVVIKEEPGLISSDLVTKLKGLVQWDRNSKLEKAYLKEIKKALQ